MRSVLLAVVVLFGCGGGPPRARVGDPCEFSGIVHDCANGTHVVCCPPDLNVMYCGGRPANVWLACSTTCGSTLCD